MNRFQCVADHQRRYGVKRLCGVPGVSRSSFYHRRRTGPAEQRETIGEAVNHKRVARIMRASGIEGVGLCRRHRTTVPDPAAAKAPDLIGRDFTAGRPKTKYAGDITYLPIHGGDFHYRAAFVDLAPRRPASRVIVTTYARTS